MVSIDVSGLGGSGVTFPQSPKVSDSIPSLYSHSLSAILKICSQRKHRCGSKNPPRASLGSRWPHTSLPLEECVIWTQTSRPWGGDLSLRNELLEDFQECSHKVPEGANLHTIYCSPSVLGVPPFWLPLPLEQATSSPD